MFLLDLGTCMSLESGLASCIASAVLFIAYLLAKVLRLARWLCLALLPMKLAVRLCLGTFRFLGTL